jgi:amidase
MPAATDLARAVRTGDLDPVSVVEDMSARISCGNAAFGAFQRVRHDEAIAEAAALTDRSDLADLALAGVPIAVKEGDRSRR